MAGQEDRDGTLDFQGKGTQGSLNSPGKQEDQASDLQGRRHTAVKEQPQGSLL